MYLVNRIDECLSIVPAKAINHITLIFVGKNGRDQGDALTCGGGAINQTFPHWRTAASRKEVRLTNARCKIKPDKWRKFCDTSSVCGRRWAS